MDPRTILTRGVSTGLRLGRGTADRVVTLAGPPLGRLTDKVVVEGAPPRAARPHDVHPLEAQRREPSPDAGAARAATTPSPAAVARNIGPPRPTAKPARPAKPKSVPGAKLPPPRAQRALVRP